MARRVATSNRRRERLRLPGLSASSLALALGVAFVGLALLDIEAGEAQARVPSHFSDQLVIGNLRQPTGLAFLPDGRLLVVEQAGAVRMIVEGKLGAIDPIGVVDSVLVSGEQGLTGVAVDYRWPSSPYVYVYYDADGLFCRLTRYRAVGDLSNSTSANLALDPLSRYDLIRDIPDQTYTHNGGTVRFGNDHMLYVGLGEDAFACGAQDTTSLRGVMLRLRVDNLPDGPGGPPAKSLMVPPDNPWAGMSNPNARLVWSTGLRNPFRFHVDSGTGRLFVGDVGWNLYEEVDIINAPALNFGWPYFEGPAPYASSCPGLVAAGTYEPPIYAYDRSGFTAAVISAGVYRGSKFPAEYDGDYFFSDYYEGFLRRLKFSDGFWDIAQPVAGQPNALDWATGMQQVSDYLVAPDGTFWYVRMAYDYQDDTGEVRQILYEPEATDVGPRGRNGLELLAPAPSPSRGGSTLRYRLPREARVELGIFDAQGRRIHALVRGTTQPAGEHRVFWDGRLRSGEPAPSGLYLIRMSVDGHVLERRLSIIR